MTANIAKLPGVGETAVMPISFTPQNKVELVGCFYDIDRSRRVEVKGGAAELLQPYTVYTVKAARLAGLAL